MSEETIHEQKHNLIRSYDSGEVSEYIFNKKIKEIQDKIDIDNRKIMDDFNAQTATDEEPIVQKTVRRNKMSEEQKIEKVKTKRKTKKDNYAAYIEKALCMKSVKNINDVIEKVTVWKPGKTGDAITTMTKNIIFAIKKQKQPRWRGYVWDNDNFLLTAPEE